MTLQAVAIRGLQLPLVKAARDMMEEDYVATAESHKTLCDGLHSYCEALRDLDYMQSKAGGGFSRDPFLLKSSRSAEREMMRKKGFSIDAEWWRDSTEEARWEKVPPSYDDGAPPVLPGIDGSRINNARFRARLYNLMCALLVGLGLIVPMIVMRLVPGKTCTLVTTSSFVMGFAVGLAVLSSFKRSEIVLVTAGYAAVLVVFVGTTS